MTGSNYAVAVSQLDNHGVIHPDAHILLMKMKYEQPYIITAIMTQCLLN